MKSPKESSDSHYIPMTSVHSGKVREVLPDVCYYTDQIVNVIFIGRPGSKWAIIDAGMPTSGNKIIEVAEARFGKSAPEAIFLTHGHFDHVGGIVEMVTHWKDVPVYAHVLEFPFLTGKQAYPAPDSSVEGGMLAKIAAIYPHEPIMVGPSLRQLPSENTLPGFENWIWIHTPGHSPGHVSFFKPDDGVLIAGDAFVTVRQDEFFKVLLQTDEVNGPPRYLTTDWTLARESVERLAALDLKIAITGHGSHMSYHVLNAGLKHLVNDFDRMAIPDYGRFVDDNS